MQYPIPQMKLSPAPIGAPIDKKGATTSIFLTIFFDLMGFSIIFPLFPTIIRFYLNDPNHPINGYLKAMVQWLTMLSKHSLNNQLDPVFCTTILFGGLFGSAYAFLQFIFAPIWGQLSDRIGRRTVLLCTLLGTCMSYCIWAFADSLFLFLLTRILAGATAGNISVANAAMADITSRADRMKGMALTGMAFSMGMIVGPVLGGLCDRWDLLGMWPELRHYGIHPLSVPAFASCILSLANVTWAFFHFPETLPIDKRSERMHLKQRFLHPLSIPTPAIRTVCFLYFVFILALSGMQFTLSFLAVERFHYTPTQTSFMFLYMGILLAVSRSFVVSHFGMTIGEKKLICIGLINGCIASIIFSKTCDVCTLYLGLTFYAFSSGIATPALSSTVSLYATENTQGQFIGTFRSLGALGQSFGPTLAACCYFYFGSGLSYLLGCGIIGIALLALTHLPNKAQA